MSELEFTAFFPFCGSGPGALGFLQAQLELLGKSARFRSLGGIDFDRAACDDFEYLTDSPALCMDIAQLTPRRLIDFAGRSSPDVVFMSPPCKGASGLLSDEKSKTAKYSEMNRLALMWTKVMLQAWGDEPPRLVLLENVPRLKTRAASMLREVRGLLTKAGYVLRDGYHDCGELGGLAQHRRRYLLVARHQKRVPPLLYQPVKKRVRACGEVIGPMPMPGDPAAGPMHILPRISWLNWVRLALIPAGGDWRDLPGVLDGAPRRSKFKRHRIETWSGPVGTVGGSGSNGVENVADPRPFGNVDRVTPWEAPVGTVTSSPAPSSGAGAVADPRIGLSAKDGRHWNKYAVGAWDDPARTVIGAIQPGSGGPAVADPRVWGEGRMGVLPFDEPARTVRGESLPSNGPFAVADPRVDAPFVRGRLGVLGFDEPSGVVTGNGRPATGKFSVADPRTGGWFNNVLRVTPWADPVGTVTGQGRPTCGSLSVADPRVKRAYDHGYAVLDFSEPSPTVASKSMPGNGAYSIADPRLTCRPRERSHAYGVIPWEEAAKTVTGAARIDNGAFAIADLRWPQEPLMVIRDVRKPPEVVPIIIAPDGTWHRPLTTLELAALQGIPTVWKGAPLKLSGGASSAWRERIGNAVPPPASRAIGERMLCSLVQADHEAFVLSGESEVWVEPEIWPS
jgi:site-specific DNA-cytosine methylase